MHDEVDVSNDVSAQVAGDRVITFVLKESAGKYTTFDSRQHSSNRPQLVIN